MKFHLYYIDDDIALNIQTTTKQQL